MAKIGTDTIAAGGFDELSLHSLGTNTDPTKLAQIALKGDVNIAMHGSLVLDTPVLSSDGGDSVLSAGYLTLGSSNQFNLFNVDPSVGDGSLLLHGEHVDLIGTLALRGFGPVAAATTPPVRIESDGDIRLIGGNQLEGSQVNQVYTDGFYSVGRLNSAADLELRANQVYTATATDFTVSVSGSGGKITIQPGGASDTPLSAGSKLTLAADNIEQNGTLLAPFGQIELDATNSLVLGGGSVTSVSGTGQLVPFGKTEFGQDWLYPLSNGSSVTNGIYTAPPEKRIGLNGSQVTLAPGSVVDVAGGGDLLATEQQPGTGGSFDILLDPAHVNGAFAIMPARQDLYGSYDPYYSSVSSVKPGNTIYIAAGGPVPAGDYAMLPAGYALMPGAYLITPLPATSSPIPGQAVQQYDGSAIVAAELSVAGTGARSNLWSAYLVQNGDQVRSRAQYLESHADTFLAATADHLNQDAGQLAIDAQTALALGGTLANNSADGRGSEVDILADNLAVVTSYTGATDRVELLDSGLNELNADSLLLGGTRQQQGTDVALNVQAKDVTVESGTALSAPEVMLAATDHVTVASGATITAADGNRARAPASIDLTGDSALARISSADQVQVQRVPGNAAAGTLDIAAGAVLDASRSITLDASQNTVVDGDMRTHDGGSLNLASSRISLGEAPARTGGLVLSNDRLSSLEASDLRLNSRGSIDFYGQVSLSNLNAVALNAAGIGGYANVGQGVSISAADTISLSNRSNAAFTGTPDGNGALNLSARQVTLGEGSFAVRGFANTTISATEQIVVAPATDTPVQLHVAGDLALQASRITASKGADASIDTQDASNNVVGKMTLTAPAILPNPVTDLGAKLELTATEMDDGGHIELPSGILNLHATTGGVTVAANASIDVSGRDLTFADSTVGSPGGNVSLTADQGNVTIGTNAHIDVSGARSGGDAGALSISATAGAVQLDPAAHLAGAVYVTDARAGSFALDTGMLTNDFSTLNNVLFTGSFTDSLQFRLRTGDVEIGTATASNATVQAHKIQLEADAGKIDVYGRLDASGNVPQLQAGQVALYARDDVSLHGGSSISAAAAGTDKKGGSVTLASSAGRLDVQAGASIDVAGTDATGAPSDSGTVDMRAARDGGSGVLINPIDPASIRGAADVNIEAYRTYTASNIDAVLINSIQSDTATYMNSASAGNINNTLGIGSDVRFHFLPGVEIDSTGDLTLNAPWDLLNWRYNGNAGVLNLRAAGNLNISKNLSDGVATVFDSLLGTLRITATTPADQSNQGNWSYRLTAGADLSSADPMAVNQDVGNVTLASGVKVRTGTGTIEVAAGNDLTLTDSTAAIYTVGANLGPGEVPDAPSLSLSADQVQEIVYNGDFLQNGGDIRIAVGGDVQGANGHQLVNDWLARAGGNIDLFGEPISLPASWAINIGNFQQNIGALGGGNVTVTAGGNVDNLSAVIPTTGQPVAGSNTPSIAGGGDLRIQAGGDIRGGVYYLGKGQAELQAGGSITAGDNSLYPVLALGDGQYSLRARKDLAIESIVNPTMLPISAMQGAIDPNSGQPFQAPLATYFFTYTVDSAAKLEAVSGDVTVREDTTAMRSVFSTLGADTVPLSYLPGTLSARSLEGDIIVNGAGFTLLPAPLGNLELLAQGSIVPATDNLSLVLSDADPAQLPNVLLPASDLVDAEKRLNPGVLTHAPSPEHRGDSQAANIVAQTGDIGSPQGSRNQLNLTLAKQTRLYAGGDVRNLKLRVQNVNTGDISVVEAGGSVTFPTLRDPSGKVAIINNADPFVLNGPGFEVAGPGQFYVIAGKDVDFGTSQGVISVGNLQNLALAAHGADITVMAGPVQAPDYGAFIERYLVDENIYHDALAQYMTGLNKPDTVDDFKLLPLVQQRKFILQMLFEELRASGAAAVASKNYDRGFAAINTLFPAASYPGDIKSFLSRIETADGGDINLVAPGGLVNAGVAGSAVINKPPVQLGVVALQEGNINALVHSDFLVNQSRVFALDGGDILIWSSTGNIDAGKGAKTALSIPPAQASTDPNTGITTVEFPPPIQGSGIGAAVRTPGKKPGDVFLVAPVGVVNAGDAGISSAGNLTIAATAVLGASNIQVAGASVGVPAADTGGLGAGIIGVSNVASSVTKSTDDAVKGLTDNTDSDLSLLDVQVTGFGDDQGGEVVNLRKRKKEP
ncbi:MAG TPA: filamentous hemagglutinin family protein [Nitrospiria bacterium]|nr:filamentous hemagglutinin family protein [Nitrospiria bacterium]